MVAWRSGRMLVFERRNLNVALFVPLQFRSQERKVHKFRSRGTFAPVELLFLGSKSANVPRTFAPKVQKHDNAYAH